MMRGWFLLLFFVVLPALAISGAQGNRNLALRCHPDQSAALLQLKKSFFFDTLFSDEDELSTTILQSWQDESDCCRWEGVACSGSSGHVISLDLNGRGLYSRGLDPAVFNLTSLQFLDLSRNNFYGYNIPAVGFERLTFLTHLNLSNSGFYGEIPIAIGKNENLVSLDLSNHYGPDDDDDYDEIGWANWLSLSNFQTFVRNLSNLREFYLDDVEIHSTGEEWCRALAKFVPRLRVLSLESCFLYGPLHESLSNLSSLTVINLQYNDGIHAGPFPLFFMGFVNLSVLQLADTNLEGKFPRRNFQSENLMVLDLSGNMNLSGSLPNFSDASSLVTLRLDDTNFSSAEPSYFANFMSLKELSLDGKFISMDFVSSLSMLGSLGQLQLSRVPFSEMFGEILSLIGDLRNLTSLTLVECDFSSMKPYSISNLSLKSLIIVNCNFTMPVLSAVGNLIGLESLYISGCRVHGSMPSSIGNLTNLKTLHTNDCGFLGLMPSSIGNLINLRNLNIYSTNFFGAIPSTVGFLRNLESLKIYECKFTGPMPSTIVNLSNLRSMDIYNCEISGPIPSAIGFLRSLNVLNIFGCMFSGPIPYTVGQLKELKIVRLIGNNFSGEIPTSIGNLTHLLTLDLSRNFLRGKISIQVVVYRMCCIM
jgi:Leucine-rich repeat (LRR) protein